MHSKERSSRKAAKNAKGKAALTLALLPIQQVGFGARGEPHPPLSTAAPSPGRGGEKPTSAWPSPSPLVLRLLHRLRWFAMNSMALCRSTF